MCVYELVIKNNPVKKTTQFFDFMVEVHLPHDNVLVLEPLRQNVSPQKFSQETLL